MIIEAPPAPSSNVLEAAARVYPHTFGAVASRGKFQLHRWVRYAGKIVGDAIMRGGARIIINVRPRVGKSELFSHWLPIWFLEQWPTKHVILGSHTGSLAVDFGRRARNEFASNPMLMTRLREDSTAAGRWNTDQHGSMFCVGTGGAVLGRGGDLLIGDDLTKDMAAARSPTAQAALRDWWKSTFMSRLEPNASVINIMQRFDKYDLTAWLLKEYPGRWTVIRLPAIAEEDDPLGRETGDAICPERYDEAAQDEERIDFGDEVWAAMYQQTPKDFRSGVTYRNFDERNISDAIELRQDLPLQVSADFNINPGMHLEVGQHAEQADVFSCVHEIHGPRMDVVEATDALVKLIKHLGGWQWPELHIFGDATGSTEWTGTSESLYQVLVRGLERELGPRVIIRRRVPKANPPVIDRVMAFNDALRDAENRVHYVVHPRCERLIADFELLRLADDGLPDKTDRKLSHASDGEGYRIAYLRPLRTRRQRKPGRFSVSVN